MNQYAINLIGEESMKYNYLFQKSSIHYIEQCRAVQCDENSAEDIYVKRAENVHTLLQDNEWFKINVRRHQIFEWHGLKL